MGRWRPACCANPYISLATVGAAVCLTVLFSTSCGWQDKLAWRSPYGNAAIEIQQKLPVNFWGLRVILTSGGQTVVLLEQRGDSLIQFAHVYWTKDSSATAVFGCGIQNQRVAYNLKEGHPMPFETLAANVAASIRSEYGLSADKKDEDVFVWACGYGTEAFSKKHPRLR